MATATPGPIPPRPDPLPGTTPLTPETLRALQWVSFRHFDIGLLLYITANSLLIGTLWLVRGLPYGQPLDPAGGIIAALAMFAAGLVCLPFGIWWSITRWRRQGWVVGYFDDTATQLVHPTPEGAWQLSDHHAHRRGHRSAAPFRQRVFQHLAHEADRHQVVIITDTRVRKLANLYIGDLPGLTLTSDSRRDHVGRRIYELRRTPNPVTST